MFSDRERPRVGVSEEQEVSMSLNRAFGPAGGSRRVVEIHRRVGGHFGQRSNLSDGLQPCDVDHCAARRRNRAGTIEQTLLGQQYDGLAVQQDVAQTLLWIAGVHWNIDVAAPARPEDRLDGGSSVLEEQAHAPWKALPHGDDRVCDGRRCGIELSEGDCRGPLDNRNPLREAARELRESDADRLHAGINRRGHPRSTLEMKSFLLFRGSLIVANVELAREERLAAGVTPQLAARCLANRARLHQNHLGDQAVHSDNCGPDRVGDFRIVSWASRRDGAEFLQDDDALVGPVIDRECY